MTGHEIREKFLRYFASSGHRVVPSSSLVPANDRTLLFANAGMNQFKDVFLGLEPRDYVRAASAQKCVRAGGKHNDLENVGRTRRHHTFFEMLGNFSFGDYFKEEAIDFAWDIVTKVFALPKDRLYATVFDKDDEAERLWKKVTDIDSSRVFRRGAKDNFWQMGDTGPCGPCSEIFYDYGPDALEPGERDEPFPSESSRYVEIWNLVFMEFDRDKDGKLSPLPKPSIDTGMGLERTAAVLQGKFSNFETDLILPIIDRTAQLLGGLNYGDNLRTDTILRIIADHSRAVVFLVHDGVLPANEGRGYVLRKIIRRTLRHARLAGVDHSFLCELADFVSEVMKPGYPELIESADRIARVVEEEEIRYQRNFALAEGKFESLVGDVKGHMVPGLVSFKLYDSYGLSLDEQEELAGERQLQIDTAGFETEMKKQRSRARASWKGSGSAAVLPVYQKLRDEGETQFDGYRNLSSKNATIVGLLIDGQLVNEVLAGSKAELVLDRTPFYAEAGGQIGDKGEISVGSVSMARVLDVTAPLRGLSAHKIEVLGSLKTGQQVNCQVDFSLRQATMRNHTATHLLHAALKKVLGPHVKQAGSVVGPDRLRFDITHYTAVSTAELEETERLVNEQILQNSYVATDLMPIDSALKTGAVALFGEKYGDMVRVVRVSDFSTELCGGTHVNLTGDIGVFKVITESGISAGVRRLEAVTGTTAYEKYREAIEVIDHIASIVKSSESDLIGNIERLATEHRGLEREVDRLKAKLAQSSTDLLARNVRTVKGIKVVAAKVDGLDRKQMRVLADSLRSKIGSGVVVLGAPQGANVALISAVTKDLAGEKIHAGKLVAAVARTVDGRGGGRPDIAEAAGRNSGALRDALESVFDLVGELSEEDS